MKKKPRYTATGRITKNKNDIWTGCIDEKGAMWWGCVAIHRDSHAAVKRLRDRILKEMNK